MLTIRQRPEAITPALLALIRPKVQYDVDGRYSTYLPAEANELRRLARFVCPEVDSADFRDVVLQAYRDGNAITPCHRDAATFGFILSIGATRTFRIHREPCRDGGCRNPGLDIIDIECVHGTVIRMDASFHEGWHHQVLPDARVKEERLSLVFRTLPTRA
jgi:alkylated DNA repair dioxygenase AlkB